MFYECATPVGLNTLINDVAGIDKRYQHYLLYGIYILITTLFIPKRGRTKLEKLAS